jgi:hypothetical protein
MLSSYLKTLLKEKCQLLMNRRNDAKRKLISLADELDLLNLRSIVKRVAGSVLNLTGGTSIVCGVLLAHATFGLSLTLTIGGILASTIGTLATIYSGMHKDVKTRRLCKIAEEVINQELKKEQDDFIKLVSSTEFRRQMENGVGTFMGKLAQEGINIASISTAVRSAGWLPNASQILVHSSRTFQMLGIGLSSIFIGIELVRLVETCIELQEQPKSAHSGMIRDFAIDLEISMVELDLFLQSAQDHLKLI